MLTKEFSAIQDHLKHIKKENTTVSKGNVGWHLDHSLKVINSVLDALIESNPKNYKKRFHFLRAVTFILGSFPRGKVKSPKRVLPPEIIEKADIENQLNLAIKKMENFKSLDDNLYFTHPIFKDLNKKQTLKFLKLHTNHHLKIIKDILK